MLKEAKESLSRNLHRVHVRRLLAILLAVCMAVTVTPVDTLAEESAGGHRHTEACYEEVQNCTHEHTSACYPEEGDATPPAPAEPTKCPHICDETSGCITRVLTCGHGSSGSEETGKPGESGAQGGTGAPEEPATPSEGSPKKCICEELCTEDAVNHDCPVCGDVDADLSDCKGKASVIDQEAVDEVTALLRDLPTLEEFTELRDSCPPSTDAGYEDWLAEWSAMKEQINTAIRAYRALNDGERALVPAELVEQMNGLIGALRQEGLRQGTGTVASIGDTKYTTLQAAVDDVKEGETITLLENTQENIIIKEESTISFTLDLNGKTLSNPENKNAITHDGSGELTVKDSVGEGTIRAIGNVYSGILSSNENGSVTVYGGRISGDHDGIYSESGSVTVYGGTINGGDIGISTQTGTITAYGGVISSELGTGINNSEGSVIISGGTVSGGLYGISNPFGTTTISGSSVIIGKHHFATNKATLDGCFQIKGSTTKTDGSETKIIAVDDIDTADEVKNYKYLKFEKTAFNVSIDATKYCTLQDAVNSVTDGQTIKMLNNIEESITIEAGRTVSFTLDLNGHTLNSGSDHTIIHNGSGELTVKDSGSGGMINGVQVILNQGEGSIKITGGLVSGFDEAIDNRSGTITVSGGTISTSSEGIVNGSGTVTVLGGTVSSGKTGIVNDSGTVTVSGGTINGDVGGISNGSGTVIIAGTSVIEGGYNAMNIAPTLEGHFTIEGSRNDAEGSDASPISAADIATDDKVKEYKYLKFTEKQPEATVTSVTVYPGSISVQKGGTKQFTATVAGTNSPDQTVIWSVSGGTAGTSISNIGVLTVASDETAATLTVKATSTADNAKSGTAVVTVTDRPVPAYVVTVIGGTGSGSYTEGETVRITAGQPETGKVFDTWITADGVSFADAGSASTSFTMPAKAVTVTAAYKDSNSGSGNDGDGTGGGGGNSSGGSGSSGGGSGNSGGGSSSGSKTTTTTTTTPATTNQTGDGGSITSSTTTSSTGTTVNTQVKKDANGQITEATAEVTAPAAATQDQSGQAKVEVRVDADAVAAAAKSAGTSVSVDVKLPTETIKEQLTNPQNQSVNVDVQIPSSASANAAAPVTSISLDKEAVEAAKAAGKDLTVTIKDEKGNVSAQWTFDGTALKNSPAPAADVNLQIRIRPVKTLTGVKEDIKAEVSGVTGTPGEQTAGLNIDFGHSGLLPAAARIRIPAGNDAGIQPGDTVYLYYYNPVMKQLEALPDNQYAVDADGYVTVRLDHCSDYVLIPQTQGGTPALPWKEAAGLPAGTIRHTVKRGDTIYKLAKAYGCTVSEILALNHVPDIYDLKVGQELAIPVR